ncbi:MAG: hypothetical protein R3315_00955 [Woeseiaceae bacterium]|nr:hypothetical protein [Woeseiaceae bacterium]
MPTISRTHSVLTALAAAALIAGCGMFDREPESALADADGILGHVPADTPYVFASVEPMPDEVLDRLEASADSMYSAYATIIEASLEDAADQVAERGGSEEDAEFVAAVASELVQLLRSDNLRAAGIPRGAQMAFYGVGLLPVARIELANSVAFEAKLAEIETNVGREMTTGTVQGVSYRYAGDDTMRLVVSVTEDYAVAALVPAASSEEHLAAVLGIKAPRSSVADSGSLTALAESYSYGAYGLGYVDIVRVASVFLDEPSAANADFLRIAGWDPSALDDVCRDEIRGLAGIVPRIVSGYTNVNAASLDSNTVIEIRSDIAAGLSTLAAPVPGLGRDHGGLGSFGMSIDLFAAREFMEQRIADYEADPYRCTELTGVGVFVDQLRASLSRPVPPIAYGFKGFLAVIDRIEGLDLAGQQPPEHVDARLIVASENAPGLLAMGAMFSPELASLDLRPDGQPLKVPLPVVTGPVREAWIALTDTALALSVGEVPPERLSDLLQSPPAEPLPSLSMRIDGARYYGFIGEAIRAGEAAGDGDGEDVPEEVRDAMTQVMSGFGDFLERIAVDVTLTDRGVEVPTTITLADPR